jgi:hypothetical protein
MSKGIRLGPKTKHILKQARWGGKDDFPASQGFADEFEKLLTYIDRAGQFQRFCPRLTATKTQRDETLQEIRVAYFFDLRKFPITSWEPLGHGVKTGEFCIRTSPSDHVFIEVKSPGWEGELGPAERAAGRAKQEKYIDGKVRWHEPWERIRFTIQKAYPKFSPNQPNLLVIADDFFVSLKHGTFPMRIALFEKSRAFGDEQGYFVGNSFEKLGGVGTFWVETSDGKVGYGFRLFTNPRALQSVSLPQTLSEAFDAKSR